MKLTNNRNQGILYQDQSSDFQKYFLSEDKQQLYNYSNSYNNQTLLLESTEAKPKPIQNYNKLKHLLQQQSQTLNKSHSFLEDFYEQLQITISQSGFDNLCEGNKKQNINNLYNMCQNLIGTLKKLQTKVEKMQYNDRKSREQSSKQSPSHDSQNQALSILSYSSLKNSKGCKCQGSNSKILMGNIFQYVECKSKLQIYKQQNQQLKRQVIKLEVSNQDIKKTIKKLQMENVKVKQLLRQYQNLNKKQTTVKKDILNQGDRLNLRASHQLKKNHHIRSNTLEDNHFLYPKQNKRMQFRDIKVDKQNLQDYYQQNSKQDYDRLSPLTPNPFIQMETYPQEFNFQKTDFKKIIDQKANKYEIKESTARPTQKKMKPMNFKHYRSAQHKQRNKSIKMQHGLRKANYYPFNELLEQQNYEIVENHSNNDNEYPHADTRKFPTCKDLDKMTNKIINKSLICSPNKLKSMKSQSNLTLHKISRRN